MKNTINYFYDIRPNDVHQSDDKYKFNYDNKIFLLIPYYGNINNMIEIYSYLIRMNIYCHEIIYNRNGEIITTINNKPYVLLKIHMMDNQKISFQNILSYNIEIDTDKKCNWYNLWCEKIDYYEYQINQYGKKYPLIRDSFGYYDGMCETAISLIKMIDVSKVNMYVSHNRINKNSDLIDFYNPLNMNIDVKIRDICEYFKNRFFYNFNIIKDIENYIMNANLTYEEAILFFARLIYPSYYFDLYDEIIQGKTPEDQLLYYVEKTQEYELLLHKVYILLNNIYKIPEIEWIIKT